MINGKSWPQNATYCIIPFILNSQNRDIYRDRKEISDHVEQGQGGGWKIIVKKIEFLCEHMKTQSLDHGYIDL